MIYEFNGTTTIKDIMDKIHDDGTGKIVCCGSECMEAQIPYLNKTVTFYQCKCGNLITVEERKDNGFLHGVNENYDEVDWY